MPKGRKSNSKFYAGKSKRKATGKLKPVRNKANYGTYGNK